MKFGKSIRAEARNNRGLSFINFKHLKRILKRCVAAANSSQWAAAQELDTQFRDVLECEMQRVGESFWKELHEISALQYVLQEKLPYLDFQPDPETYMHMNFEELQAHLQSLGGLCEVPPTAEASSSVRTSVALCDFCVNLGKISARSKRLRRGVLWNAVAIVKILKKRQKSLSEEVFTKLTNWKETSAQVLSRQDWYRCPELSRLASIVETTTDELMQRLTCEPPSRERYQCPICLDVILDPVCLRTCGHRFCWACLCMAYCEKPEGTLERCPSCRAVFPLDPKAFEIDGILSRFLRNFFPDLQSKRIAEQQENIRLRLANLRSDEFSTVESDGKRTESQHHCCPDCITSFDYKDSSSISSSAMATLDLKSSRRDSEEPHRRLSIGCKHIRNVRLGRPADVDQLAFSPLFNVPVELAETLPSSENMIMACGKYDSPADFDENTAVVDRMVESLFLDSPIALEEFQGRSIVSSEHPKIHPKLISMMRDHLRTGGGLLRPSSVSCESAVTDSTSISETATDSGVSVPIATLPLLFGGFSVDRRDHHSQEQQQQHCFQQERVTASLPDFDFCDLPDIAKQHGSHFRHLNMLTCDQTLPSYYEAVDDEDDEIEAEYLKQCPAYNTSHATTTPNQRESGDSLAWQVLFSPFAAVKPDRVTVL